jgi:endoribonuclease Dicer
MFISIHFPYYICDRRGELNVVISTSVVEEGLDVRKCNLIIRYEFPPNFRSYVQVRRH